MKVGDIINGHVNEVLGKNESLSEHLRYPTEFDTIEWRMGTPTFNFTKLTIQILCAIHITNAVFKEKEESQDYINCLAELYTKIDSKQ